MSEAKHTPLPWAADPDWREGYSWNIHIVQSNNPEMRICFMTSDGPAQENADLIVSSVNSLPDLVKALEGMLVENDSEEADDACELCDGCGEVSATTARSDRDQIGCPACIERARSRSARAALTAYRSAKP